MNNSKKDLSRIGIYLTLLQDAISLCKSNPSFENKEKYRKYLSLYCKEYNELFKCEPDTIRLKEFKNLLHESEDREFDYGGKESKK